MQNLHASFCMCIKFSLAFLFTSSPRWVQFNSTNFAWSCKRGAGVVKRRRRLGGGGVVAQWEGREPVISSAMLWLNTVGQRAIWLINKWALCGSHMSERERERGRLRWHCPHQNWCFDWARCNYNADTPRGIDKQCSHATHTYMKLAQCRRVTLTCLGCIYFRFTVV